jgi:uncharacterized membrane protein YeaQ/YmgE (transglycosylase-associated protein family)
MEILWFLIIGLIAGWLAKLVVPGREPGGFLATMAIGVVGALIGGFLARTLFGWSNMGTGFLVAFLGSVLLLLLYHALVGGRGRVGPG